MNQENAVSKRVFENLRKERRTLAFAESITAGNLCSEIVKYAGSSDVLLGGIVAYSNSVKMNVLGVKESTLNSRGAVSGETVREMVSGLHRKIPADFCAAVSGIAGPGGGTAEKPVGTVWLGIRHDGKVHTEKRVFDGGREEVIRSCVAWVYEELLSMSS